MLDPDTLARLQGIGLTPLMTQRVVQALLAEADANARSGNDRTPALAPSRVVEVQRAHVRLHDGHDESTARLLPRLAHALDADGDMLAVGDWVLAAPDAFGDAWVHARVEPANQIARRLHDGRDKVARVVIVANVDTLLVTMGLDADFNLPRLARYLTLATIADVQPLVVLTKADLCDDVDARLAAAQDLLPPLAQAIAVNGLDAARTQAAFAPWLTPGHTFALIGSSGAGKSTLTNAIVGRAAQATGGTRTGDGRGRHTTTVRTLHRVPVGDDASACLIDTPGLRTLRLDTDEAALDHAFDDIAALALHCRFRDCRHDTEPGCAVRAGVDAQRLRHYRKLQREASRDTMSLLERQRQHAVWRARSRASRARTKLER